MKQNPQMAKIQENMQPGTLSAEGFLGEDRRSLSDILLTDSQIVQKNGQTHQSIADQMRRLTEAGKPELGRPLRLGQFEVTVEDHRGRLPCPFRDRYGAEKRITTAKHLATGQTLTWTDLHIHMIEAHGFYEGLGSKFRLDPERLIEFFFSG